MEHVNLGDLVYLLILVVIVIATLVRKLFEKATRREEGKKIDLKEAVREQLRRYMGDADGPFPGPVLPRPAPPPPVPAPAPEPPAPASPPTAPEPALAAETRGNLTATAAARSRTAPRFRPERSGLGQAILLAEILGPPVSERGDERLV